MALTAVACARTNASGGGEELSGAGATFPTPVYQAWAEAYQQASKVQVSYAPIGSGGGLKQIGAATVDFGGSDEPQTAAVLKAQGLEQFPTVVGGVVPVLNLSGVAPGRLRLDGPLLADIFAGKVTTWSDPRIAAMNPGISLPSRPISVVHRSDGSGSTFLFTTYLSRVSPAWKASPGAADAIQWPVGVGAKGNDGVAGFVKQTPGAIGYVEYAYAVQNSLGYADLVNRAGRAVAPTAAGFAAAASGATWDAGKGFYLLLLDQPEPDAWPITGATFVLVRRDASAAKTAAVRRFFDWAFTSGDAAAARLDYVPLPAAVKAQVRRSWTAAAPSASH